MRQWTIDAFTTQLFRGNPAAVVEPFDVWPDEDWMQRLAAENNLSETAFLLRTNDPARFGLRWFTPTTEVPLCGHATMATTHALFAEMGLNAERIGFDTLSGPLQVSRIGGLYEMDFPSSSPRRVDPPPGLIEGLGVTPKEVWVASYLIAVLEDEAQVRAVTPNYALLDSVTAGAPQLPGNVGVCALSPRARPMTWRTGSSPRAWACRKTRSAAPCTASWLRSMPASWDGTPFVSTRPIRAGAAIWNARCAATASCCAARPAPSWKV
jgi:predicted PhzF superfamily epimerase YddE/YHI9